MSIQFPRHTSVSPSCLFSLSFNILLCVRGYPGIILFLTVFESLIWSICELPFHHCDRWSDCSIVGERVDLAHSFGEFSPWSPRTRVLEQNIMVMRMCREGYLLRYVMMERKQCVRKELSRYSHHSHAPGASSLSRPRLSNFPPTFNTGACVLYSRDTKHPFPQLLVQYIHVALKKGVRTFFCALVVPEMERWEHR